VLTEITRSPCLKGARRRSKA